MDDFAWFNEIVRTLEKVYGPNTPITLGMLTGILDQVAELQEKAAQDERKSMEKFQQP